GLNLLATILLLCLLACQSSPSKEGPTPTNDQPLFTKIQATESGIDFVNRVPEDQNRNILRYQYYYNGGGVAIGDVNGDDLPDVCFSSNIGSPVLYLNQGNMQFQKAGPEDGLDVVAGASWSTGISMVDINADGWLDIYLCRSGNLKEENRRNLLFVNQRNGTFKERGAFYGLDDPGYSMHAAFLDYDKDGDLDLFLANHGVNFYGRDPQGTNSKIRDRFSGDKLYRNDNRKFTDITESAGIEQKAFSYGLGIAISDLDDNGWDDIYVSNDFFEHDYLYYNQGDGTFKQAIQTATEQTSFFSMGNDIADLNNDGLSDLFVLDMTPGDHRRRQTNLDGLSYQKFWEFVDKGYHYQYMFNALQVNNGNGTFSNISRLAGVSQTDWSWAPLLADLDNDGLKDIYITNGLRKDVLNLDFINITSADFTKYAKPDGSLPREYFIKLLEAMPSEKVQNPVYQNLGQFQFKEQSKNWGLQGTSFSNGASYADLDLDGDLDLVVNNIDETAFVFQNNAQTSDKNWIRLQLNGPKTNPFGIGAKVSVKTTSQNQFQQLFTSRGFQSSVEPIVHFGLDTDSQVDIEVKWPDGKVSTILQTTPNQKLSVNYSEAIEPSAKETTNQAPLFKEVALTANLSQFLQSGDKKYESFRNEFLLPHELSNEGPAAAQTDLNGDGLSDLYLGGAAGTPGKLGIQNQNGGFRLVTGPWEKDAASEDIDALFFDADADGDQDLYVVSGSNEFPLGDSRYQDRLYINDGNLAFTKAPSALPEAPISNSAVAAADFDQDGDLDLFVAGFCEPGAYPKAPLSVLLRNEGGKFTDATQEVFQGALAPGMVRDVLWNDWDQDGDADLILAGEWMNLLFFKNENKQLKDITNSTGLPDLSGIYFTLTAADIDQDGDEDFIIGGMGQNHRYQASTEAPIQMFAADFDANGQVDPIMAYTIDGKAYPIYGRTVLGEQLPALKKRFPDFGSYAEASIPEMFSPEGL
ncbi:MAG: VCBS repeat-containing protein, partial [Bacteroidota bacterium]